MLSFLCLNHVQNFSLLNSKHLHPEQGLQGLSHLGPPSSPSCHSSPFSWPQPSHDWLILSCSPWSPCLSLFPQLILPTQPLPSIQVILIHSSDQGSNIIFSGQFPRLLKQLHPCTTCSWVTHARHNLLLYTQHDYLISVCPSHQNESFMRERPCLSCTPLDPSAWHSARHTAASQMVNE